MERTFDTNYILNDIYVATDGIIRIRRFDSNYIWNAIYDPDLPGIRVGQILGMNTTDLGDMPNPLVANMYIQVNADGTAYEYVEGVGTRGASGYSGYSGKSSTFIRVPIDDINYSVSGITNQNVALPNATTLEKEKADKFNYPLDGWYYFISEEAAIAFKNL